MKKVSKIRPGVLTVFLIKVIFSGNLDTEVIFACLFIFFLVVLPIMVKIKCYLDKFKNLSDLDVENGIIYRSISTVTLRVPENGGVE